MTLYIVFWAASVVEICLAYLSYKIKRSFKVWLLLIDSFATLTLGSINVSLRPILASYLVGLAAFFVIGNLRRGLRKSGIDYKTSEVKKFGTQMYIKKVKILMSTYPLIYRRVLKNMVEINLIQKGLRGGIFIIGS